MARQRQAGEDETGANRLTARAPTDKAQKPPELKPTGVRFEEEGLVIDVEDGEAVTVPVGVPVVVNGVAAGDPARLGEWFEKAKKASPAPGQPPAVRLTVARDESGAVSAVRFDQ